MFTFAKFLGVAHGNKILQNVTDAVVALDPATATEAQLNMMEDSLSKVSFQLAKFRADSAREHTEAVATQQRMDRLKAAGTKLNADFEAETDPTKKAALGTSLNGLLSTLEGIKAELDQHTQFAADGDKLVAETEVIFQQKASDITTAKAALATATRNLAAAKINEEHSKEMADHAAEQAGLRQGQVDGLNSALSSMQRQTETARVSADASRMKAEVLNHAEAGGLDDPNVKAALAAVTAAPSSQSFADRLSALG
jgi:dynactin complex subunit